MYKNKLVFFLFLVTLSCTSKAANIDSLLAVLKKSKEDSNKVKILYDIGFLYGIEKSDSSNLSSYNFKCSSFFTIKIQP